jgi:drug/metabolite transporter (DMT)-like permease
MKDDDGAAQAREARRQRLTGIAMMCGTLLCFSGLDASAKYLGRTMPTLQIVWVRYLFSVVMILALFNPWTRPGVLRTRRPVVQSVRSLLVLGSTVLNFLALHYLQLAQTTSISFATPLLVALAAAPVLGEAVGARRLAAIVVGFAGVLVVTRPGLGSAHPAVLLSVGASVCNAGYAVMTRMLAGRDSTETTLVYSGLAGVVLLLPALPFVWRTPPTGLHWTLMIAMGVFGTIGHGLLIAAHQRAPAVVLSPFMYTQLIWMTALGYVVFGDLPDRFTVIGAMIVVASGLYLLQLERGRTAPRKF